MLYLNYNNSMYSLTKVVYTLRNKGTKAVTGVVPFQKVHFCIY